MDTSEQVNAIISTSRSHTHAFLGKHIFSYKHKTPPLVAKLNRDITELPPDSKAP